MNRILTSMAAFVVLSIGLAARGSVITAIQQQLHATASASAWSEFDTYVPYPPPGYINVTYGEGTNTSTPADVSAGAVYGPLTHHASTGITGVSNSTSASVDIQSNIQQDRLSLSITASGGEIVTAIGLLASSSATATLDFSVTQATQFNYTFSSSTVGAGTSIALTSGGQTIWSGASSSGTLSLDVGQYELHSVFNSGSYKPIPGPGTSSYISGSQSFSMVTTPEPAGLGVVAVGLMLLWRRGVVVRKAAEKRVGAAAFH